VNAILEQLGINKTFFYQLGIFAILFFLLSRTYFRPFLKLFEARHRRTVADREAADKLMIDAKTKLDQYKIRISQEREAARLAYEEALLAARKEESALLAKAREEAKEITHRVAESVIQQREQLRKQLESDADGLARVISERLLSRKV
jgi:F-type H+-transporting ATPase subunit b